MKLDAGEIILVFDSEKGDTHSFNSVEEAQKFIVYECAEAGDTGEYLMDRFETFRAKRTDLHIARSLAVHISW